MAAILKHMAHLGWILPAIGGYFGGILTTLMGHVVKYSFDKATELKALIGKIDREIEAFKAPASKIVSQSWKLGPAVSPSDWIRSTPIFSEYSLDLKSGLKLIRWYFFIRHWVGLPSKKDVEEAAKLLPQLSQVKSEDYQQALVIADKIKRLLA